MVIITINGFSLAAIPDTRTSYISLVLWAWNSSTIAKLGFVPSPVFLASLDKGFIKEPSFKKVIVPYEFLYFPFSFGELASWKSVSLKQIELCCLSPLCYPKGFLSSSSYSFP